MLAANLTLHDQAGQPVRKRIERAV